MRHASRHILTAVTLGAGLLFSGLALAKSPQQQEREEHHDSCLGECKDDLKDCEKQCKKHGGEATNLCVKACTDLHKECEQDCKKPGSQK